MDQSTPPEAWREPVPPEPAPSDATAIPSGTPIPPPAAAADPSGDAGHPTGALYPPAWPGASDPGAPPYPGIPAIQSVPPAPVVTKKRSSASAGTAALVLAGALAIGGVAFAAGRLTAPATANGTGGFGNGQLGTGRFFGQNGNGQVPGGAVPSGAPGFIGRGGFGGASVEGTVESVDASSITLKLASGQTVTIPTDSSTTYNEQTSSSASAVTPGSSVIVRVDIRGDRGPNASPGAGASPGIGAAQSVTVVQP
jgi:hypothetical protein